MGMQGQMGQMGQMGMMPGQMGMMGGQMPGHMGMHQMGGMGMPGQMGMMPGQMGGMQVRILSAITIMAFNEYSMNIIFRACLGKWEWAWEWEAWVGWEVCSSRVWEVWGWEV